MKGIMFTFTIAIISYILAKFPILHTIGALAIAIIFAMIYRQVIGYPEHIRPGLNPFLSVNAPILSPLQKEIIVGPSHGSIK